MGCGVQTKPATRESVKHASSGIETQAADVENAKVENDENQENNESRQEIAADVGNAITEHDKINKIMGTDTTSPSIQNDKNIVNHEMKQVLAADVGNKHIDKDNRCENIINGDISASYFANTNNKTNEDEKSKQDITVDLENAKVENDENQENHESRQEIAADVGNAIKIMGTDTTSPSIHNDKNIVNHEMKQVLAADVGNAHIEKDSRCENNIQGHISASDLANTNNKTHEDEKSKQGIASETRNSNVWKSTNAKDGLKTPVSVADAKNVNIQKDEIFLTLVAGAVTVNADDLSKGQSLRGESLAASEDELFGPRADDCNNSVKAQKDESSKSCKEKGKNDISRRSPTPKLKSTSASSPKEVRESKKTLIKQKLTHDSISQEPGQSCCSSTSTAVPSALETSVTKETEKSDRSTCSGDQLAINNPAPAALLFSPHSRSSRKLPDNAFDDVKRKSKRSNVHTPAPASHLGKIAPASPSRLELQSNIKDKLHQRSRRSADSLPTEPVAALDLCLDSASPGMLQTSRKKVNEGNRTSNITAPTVLRRERRTSTQGKTKGDFAGSARGAPRSNPASGVGSGAPAPNLARHTLISALDSPRGARRSNPALRPYRKGS